jgi:methylase of polypeptide subunit release factors
MTEGPIPDWAAAQALGAALRRVGYVEENVLDLLGDDAYGSTPKEVPVLERRLPDTPLATVICAFFLELPVPVRDVVHALGPDGVAALERTGLAAVGKEVLPHSRILAVGDLLVASDGQAPDPAAVRADYVSNYTPTSHLCASLTPRRSVARALDVGTGCGVHALLAAQHARGVVATDVNDRALAYTELNAALNGLTNIECRHGSLFEPVVGETFDLITCNAPFVISPEDTWAYRDGGLRGDAFSERLVRGAAARLAEGGYATLLASWIATDDDEPDEHALAWVEGSGCDCWILSAYDWDPLDHAADWNSHFGGDPDAFGDVLDDWIAYLDELGASSVVEGAIILNRRAGTVQTMRSDSIDAEAIEEAGDQVQRAFESRARLAGRDDLLDARLVPAMALRLERDLEPSGSASVATGARIHIVDGMQQTVEAPSAVLEVLERLDGRATLGESVRSVDVRDDALAVCRELLEVGALRFVDG